MLLPLSAVSFGTQCGISAPTPTGGCRLLFCWCVVDVFDLIFPLLFFSFVLCCNDDGTGNQQPLPSSEQSAGRWWTMATTTLVRQCFYSYNSSRVIRSAIWLLLFFATAVYSGWMASFSCFVADWPFCFFSVSRAALFPSCFPIIVFGLAFSYFLLLLPFSFPPPLPPFWCE